MNSGVHHTYYRVVRSSIPGFWTGVCKLCTPPQPTKSRPSVGQAEESVYEHLRDKHDITNREDLK